MSGVRGACRGCVSSVSGGPFFAPWARGGRGFQAFPGRVSGPPRARGVRVGGACRVALRASEKNHPAGAPRRCSGARRRRFADSCQGNARPRAREATTRVFKALRSPVHDVRGLSGRLARARAPEHVVGCLVGPIDRFSKATRGDRPIERFPGLGAGGAPVARKRGVRRVDGLKSGRTGRARSRALPVPRRYGPVVRSGVAARGPVRFGPVLPLPGRP